MTFSLVGTGNIGGAIAGHFSRVGQPLQLANASGPASLTELVVRLGPTAQAVTVPEALTADVVILAIPFTAIADVVKDAPHWHNRIVVDASNAIDFPDFTPTDLGGRPSSSVVSDWVPGARVVKAFNTLAAPVLAQPPDSDGGRRVLFLSGDDHEATATVAALITSLGFHPVVLGPLAGGGLLQQFGGALTNQDVSKH